MDDTSTICTRPLTSNTNPWWPAVLRSSARSNGNSA